MTIIDNKYIATGSYDDYIKIYDLKTYECKKIIIGIGEPILCFSTLKMHKSSLFLSSSFD